VTWPFGDLPMFGFDFVMVDPPWRFETWSNEGKEKSADAHYGTMGLNEIAALPIGHLGSKDCVYWIWATHPMLPQQIGILPALGLTYVTSGVWVKRTVKGKLAFGTGYRLRCASEPFLIATNGRPDTVPTVRTVIEGPIREHSRKPDEAYIEAERMMPRARRADLFSRQTRPGWSAWGNEAGKFDRVAA
jgi:N6-adenosine-specific RNA methylase IME4